MSAGDGTIDSISAEQILQEAYDQRKKPTAITKVDILDVEELKDWQRRKRTEYETVLKRNRLDLRQWMRYAQFEIEQKDIRRARSIYERALLINHSYIPLWIQYIDSELKWKNINHARNLLDRATNLLPRVDKLWYKYLLVEEALGNTTIARGIYIKWCSLEPGINAWDSYIDFEIRHHNLENVRNIYSRYVLVHPQVSTWMKWISFEQTHDDVSTIRTVYGLALDTLAAYESTPLPEIESLIVSFASWEASQKEYERSRSLYRLALQQWPQSSLLKMEQIEFEKKYGSSANMGYTIAQKRKAEYEAILNENPLDYSTWWLLIDLYEDNLPGEQKAVFEMFIDRGKPATLKKDTSWKRYIELWIRYLVYAEKFLDDVDLTRSLYQKLLSIIPHKHFTFAKIWIMDAQFELRHENLNKARSILGVSLGKCEKAKLYKYYIGLELQLKEFDRVRKLYEKFLAFDPNNVGIWIEYAELEENLGDEDRARGIYNISLSEEVGIPIEDKLEMIQRFIAFETDASEYDNARALYHRYLIMSNYNAIIWINWALFESTIPTDEQLREYHGLQKDKDTNGDDDDDEEFTFEITDENKRRSRDIFEIAAKYYRDHDDSQSRKLVLQSRFEYEQIHGDDATIKQIASRLPIEVKKKSNANDIEEEYMALEFPDDAAQPINNNLINLAKKWGEKRESS